MRQELAWFDTQSQTDIIAKFNLDSMAFQLAIGEKISNLIMIISMSLSGLAISLFVGWIMTLVMLAYIPIMILIWTKNIATKVEVTQEEEKVYEKVYSRSE